MHHKEALQRPRLRKACDEIFEVLQITFYAKIPLAFFSRALSRKFEAP